MTLRERVVAMADELKDDIRSGEVGPNIMCRMADNLAIAAARMALEEVIAECNVFASTTGLSGATFAEKKLRRRINNILDTITPRDGLD